LSGGGPDRRPRNPRADLVEHLRFLRELGVKEIRAATGRPGSRATNPGGLATTPEVARPAPSPAAAPGRTKDAAQGHASGAALAASARPGAADAPARSTGAGPASAKAQALALLRDQEIGDCRRCRLCEKRTKLVFGAGDPGARLMFVGEGPGHDEDVQGIPFVGRAGQLLTDIIRAMGLTREQVYIANIVKCRPPENRTPEPDEIAACRGFIEKQIEIIAPEVIVCLGAVAVQALVQASGGITRIRGQLREYRGIPVMPTFHPAYLLRNPAAKKDVWQDMKKVMSLLSSGIESS
jgi:DNA polymerase